MYGKQLGERLRSRNLDKIILPQRGGGVESLNDVVIGSVELIIKNSKDAVTDA